MENVSNRILSFQRVLNAPRELVWTVFTEPDHISKWWGPDGFTNTIEKMEVKPGGTWKHVMHGPDGTDFKNESVFVELVKPERVVFRHITGPHFVATITFKAIGDRTELNWEMLFDTAEELQNVGKVFKADVGLRQNVEKLEKYMESIK